MVRCVLLTTLVLLCTLGNSQKDTLMEDKVTIMEAEAVLDGVAKLPCDLKLSASQDVVTLVIWYKGGTRTPIYSLDIRDRSLEDGSHWSEKRILGGRAYYTTEPPYSFLILESVKEEDAGVYRCRVDFKVNPTRNSLVNLTVVVPPSKLTLLDGSGTTIHTSYIGPLHEGDSIKLSCDAYGGKPEPKVSWWRNDVMVDDTSDVLAGRRVRNVLSLETVTRLDLGTRLTCQATNTPHLPPLITTVTVDIYLGPLDVRLLDEGHGRGRGPPMSAGQDHEVTCVSAGSRPPATITWWKAGNILNYPSKVTTSGEGNVTTSVITLRVFRADAHSQLSCRAHNPHVPGSAIEDSWSLEVNYVPIVTVQLGSNINASSIREGMDVYFECQVEAAPRIRKLVWTHNGVVVNNNASTGTIITNHTLVLQSVSRYSSGFYSCVATNSEGDGGSKPYDLDVKFEPECVASQQRVYGAARMEEVSISCEVEANPPAAWFHWSFNNSAVRARGIDSFQSIGSGGRSVARYTPLSDADYGTLLCWGRNDLGSQNSPCVFHIVPAGRPEPPFNCSVMGISVRCERGFDGGLPQEFHAEVTTGGRYVSNITNKECPEFSLSALTPGIVYEVTVYSSNGKGRSQFGEHLRTSTRDIATTRHTSRIADEDNLLMVGELVLLAAGTAMAVLLVATIVARLRRLNNRRDKVPYGSDTPSSNLDDERNPDVVPQKDVDRLPRRDILNECKNASLGCKAPISLTPLYPFHSPKHKGKEDAAIWGTTYCTKTQNLSRLDQLEIDNFRQPIRPKESAV